MSHAEILNPRIKSMNLANVQLDKEEKIYMYRKDNPFVLLQPKKKSIYKMVC